MIGIDEVIEDMHLHTDCPPIKPQNECLLWFGTYAIQPLQQVHLRHGNALQLVIRRGIPVSLSDMLALTDQQLRTALQNSIWGETYRRPSYPVFPREALHFQNAMDAIRGGQATDNPVSSRTAQPTDHRPDWIRELQEMFNAHAFTENADEGPVLYVMTWLIHGHDRQRSNEGRAVKLQSICLIGDLRSSSNGENGYNVGVRLTFTLLRHSHREDHGSHIRLTLSLRKGFKVSKDWHS